jgi:hypothetical protein
MSAQGPLPELDDIDRLAGQLSRYGRVEMLAHVGALDCVHPITAFVLGDDASDAPTFAIVGGVHGLERIGTHVALAAMTTLAETLRWDELLRASLRTTRLVLVPLVNPGGMSMGRRSNPRGVDLMRNAPAHPRGQGTFLVGGHGLSPLLPWYRGREDGCMEPLKDEQLRDRPPTRLSWMKLLARVFRIDISVCSRCGGPMRIVRAVTDPDAIAAELHGARAPPRPPPPGQILSFTPN